MSNSMCMVARWSPRREDDLRATAPGVDHELHEVLLETLPVVASRDLDLEGVEIRQDSAELRATLLATAAMLQHGQEAHWVYFFGGLLAVFVKVGLDSGQQRCRIHVHRVEPTRGGGLREQIGEDELDDHVDAGDSDWKEEQTDAEEVVVPSRNC